MRISLSNKLALLFAAVMFLAIGALYLYVAPGLQTRLIDQKLSEQVLPELPKQTEALTKLTEDVASALFTMSELRRWMVDDLEAANETTMLLGETLTRLQSSIDRLKQEVTAIGKRLADIEAALSR